MKADKWFSYFRGPFPGTQGFSPYRFPGLLVHIPVWLGFLLLGYQLNVQQSWLFPALVVYFILGLYLGRDLAVLAHYNLYIVIALSILTLGYLPWIAPWFAVLRQYPSYSLVSATVDGCLLLGFVVYAVSKGSPRA